MSVVVRVTAVRFTLCPRCGHERRVVVVHTDGVSSRCYVCNDTLDTGAQAPAAAVAPTTRHATL